MIFSPTSTSSLRQGCSAGPVQTQTSSWRQTGSWGSGLELDFQDHVTTHILEARHCLCNDRTDCSTGRTLWRGKRGSSPSTRSCWSNAKEVSGRHRPIEASRHCWPLTAKFSHCSASQGLQRGKPQRRPGKLQREPPDGLDQEEPSVGQFCWDTGQGAGTPNDDDVSHSIIHFVSEPEP